MTTNGSGQTSITLSTTAKGAVQLEVKVYAPPYPVLDNSGPGMTARTATPPEFSRVQDDAIELARIAVVALCKVVDELAIAGVPTVYDEATVRSMRNHYASAVGQKAR